MNRLVKNARIAVTLECPPEMRGAIQDVFAGEYESGYAAQSGDALTVLDIGAKVGAFAYPNGVVDPAVDAVVDPRFEVAFGTQKALNPLASRRHRLRRKVVRPDDGWVDMVSRLLVGYRFRRRCNSILAQLRRKRLRGLH